MSTQQVTETPAIELIVEQDEDGQVAANVPVRWKISEEMAQTLADKGVEPFMLLVIANGTYEMDHHLVPLKAGMTFLQMRRPGTMTIYATIVWQREDGDSVKKIVMRKDDYGNYEFQAVDSFMPGDAELSRRIDELYESIHWGDLDEKSLREAQLKRKLLNSRRKRLLRQGVEVFGLRDGFHAIQRTAESDQIDVEVPEEMFAAEPPRWMNWLGTLYKWPRKAQDQCDLRRRALVTALSLPLVVPVAIVVGVFAVCVWTAVKLVACLATGLLLFFGQRNLDYSVIYEWNNIDVKDIWYDAKPSFWLFKKTKVERPHPWDADRMISETEYVRRDAAFDFINPPFVVFSFIVGRILSVVLDLNTPVLSSLISAVVGAVVIGVTASLIKRLMNGRKVAPRDEQVITAEQRSKLQRELASLTSGGAARLSELPMEQRTVRLRYLNLKTAVCKPFAR